MGLEEVLKDCSAAITMHSAVGIEALLLNKPLIIINTTGKNDAYPYCEGTKIPKCTNKEELIKVLNNLETLKPDIAFLNHHLYIPKQGTVNKITKIINKTVNKPNMKRVIVFGSAYYLGKFLTDKFKK